MTLLRKTATAALALAMLGTMAEGASARPWGYRHHGYGYGAAAGVLGVLALGALAASAAPSYSEGECYIVRRREVDYYGYVRIVRRRVCE